MSSPGTPIPRASFVLAGLGGCLGFVGLIFLGIGVMMSNSAGGGTAADGEAEVEPLSAKSGYIRGRGLTEDGRPIPAFKVRYAGFPPGALGGYDAGGGLTAPDSGYVDGKDGVYSVKVGKGMYGAEADVETEFDGQRFRFNLAATNGKSSTEDREDAGEGIVRDFVWKMSGAKPGRDPNGTTESRMYAMYGEVVKIDMHSSAERTNGQITMPPLREQYPAETEVEVTLTPKGAIIDGSPGRVIQEKFRLGQSGTIYACIREVPVGVYTVTAQLREQNGNMIPLRVGSQYSKEVNGDWRNVVFPGTTEYELHFKSTNSVIGGAESQWLYLNR